VPHTHPRGGRHRRRSRRRQDGEHDGQPHHQQPRHRGPCLQAERHQVSASVTVFRAPSHVRCAIYTQNVTINCTSHALLPGKTRGSLPHPPAGTEVPTSLTCPMGRASAMIAQRKRNNSKSRRSRQPAPRSVGKGLREWRSQPSLSGRPGRADPDQIHRQPHILFHIQPTRPKKNAEIFL